MHSLKVACLGANTYSAVCLGESQLNYRVDINNTLSENSKIYLKRIQLKLSNI